MIGMVFYNFQGEAGGGVSFFGVSGLAKKPS